MERWNDPQAFGNPMTMNLGHPLLRGMRLEPLSPRGGESVQRCASLLAAGRAREGTS
jgi:hypothetical protein